MTANHTRTWRDVASGDPYEAVLTYPVYVDLTKKDSLGNYLMLPDETVEIENPIWRQFSRDHYDKRTRTQASLNARYSPLTWLMFDAQLSYDRSDNKYQEYVPKGVPTSVTSDATSNGQLVLEHQENDAYNGALGTTLNRQFGALNGRLALRGTFEKEWRESFESEGRELPRAERARPQRRSHHLQRHIRHDRCARERLLCRSRARLQGPLHGFFPDPSGRQLALRAAHKWHTYKRAAAAYIISREEWFNLPGVDELKLRYAMGEAGGRPGFSSQYESWGISRTSGLSRENAGNPSLKPQFTREHDFGLDILAFNNRAQLELVYARQTSRDQIIIVPATVITGYSSVSANAAKVKGRTYEATLTLVPVNNRNTRWSVNFVADNTQTTLVEWERSCFWGSNAGREHERTCAGERAGDFLDAAHAPQHR